MSLILHETELLSLWSGREGYAPGSQNAIKLTFAFYMIATNPKDMSPEFSLKDIFNQIIPGIANIDKSLKNYNCRIAYHCLRSGSGGSGRYGRAGDAAIKILAIKAGLKKIDIFVKDDSGFTESFKLLRVDPDAQTTVALSQFDKCCWDW